MLIKVRTCSFLVIALISATLSIHGAVAQDYFLSDAVAPSPNLPQSVHYELELDDDAAHSEADEPDASQPETPAEAPDECQCDCLWCRPNLLGDWHGKKTALAQHGIIWDGQLTQFHQGVTEGGVRRDFDYGGKLDQFVLFDFEKMGLCCHLKAVMHVETRFGETVNPDAVPFAPVNANMLYPKPNQNDTAITHLQFELALTDEWALTFGKINTLDLLYTLYPQTGRGVDGFMNISMIAPLTVARTVPLAFLGAGVMKKRGQQIEGGFLVYDSNNITTTSGFDVLFDNGANLAGFWRFFTDWGGRPGSHLFLGSYATGDYTSLDPLGWVIIPPGAVIPGQQQGSWHATYILEQKLWVDPCNPKRNIALYSPWSVADPDTSPFEWACNVAVQAQGLCCCRENDTMGAGYFYTGLSNQFKNLLQPVAPVDDTHGFEMYYNAEVTPWFHLTADLQIIEPALQANDTAVVFGLRAKINL